MAILKKLLAAIAILVVLLLAVGVFLPSSVHVKRDIEIDAPQATVFSLINNFHQFNKWSPWHEQEPHANYTFSGPRTGTGAKLVWSGDIVGSGSQTITESHPFSRIETALDFGPQGIATASYDITAADGGSRVVWGLDTDFGNDLIGRYFGLMFDSMIGPDYEKGLANLKALAETLPRADFANLDLQLTEVKSQTIAYLSTRSDPDAAAISQVMGKAYLQISNYMNSQGLKQQGAPLSINRSFSRGVYEFDAGIPVAADPPADESSGSGAVQLASTYSGPAVKVIHIGPYRDLTDTHNKTIAYIEANGLARNGDPWETYVSDPGDVSEAELITEVYYPVLN